MKKLYQGKGRRVHPAPAPQAPADAAVAAVVLPAAVLALASALTAEEQEGKGRRVHPAPAPQAPADAAVAAVVLPAAVLALASALTAEEQEVLAYLLSGGGAAGGRRRRRGAHPPEMGCGCFGCYKSFWARWDASPNRHLIHRIIDAVEEGGGGGGAGPTRRPPRRRRRGKRGGGDCEEDAAGTKEGDASVEHHPACGFDGEEDGDYEGDGDDEEEEEEGDSMNGDADDETTLSEGDCSSSSAEKSTVGRLVRFIGEKIRRRKKTTKKVRSSYPVGRLEKEALELSSCTALYEMKDRKQVADTIYGLCTAPLCREINKLQHGEAEGEAEAGWKRNETYKKKCCI
uniref:Uncharacterized protein n=1 Tax=Oryza meridionalis TaxID=40149 RepID=A0A0E0DJW3_9ORYZ